MNGCSTPAFPGVGGVACAWSKKERLAASCSLQPAFCHAGSLAGSDISALRIGESWTIVLSHGEPSLFFLQPPDSSWVGQRRSCCQRDGRSRAWECVSERTWGPDKNLDLSISSKYHFPVMIFSLCVSMCVYIRVYICVVSPVGVGEAKKTTLAIFPQTLFMVFVWNRISHWPGTHQIY